LDPDEGPLPLGPDAGPFERLKYKLLFLLSLLSLINLK
jgi:hypothetical protein